MRNPDSQKLAELLRHERARAGLKQSELAALLRLPQSYVSKYETGEKKLDVLEYLAICHALGVSAAAIIEKLDQMIGSEV